jgi:hypothetical protein
LILRALFFQNNEKLGKKGILGQAPRDSSSLASIRSIFIMFFCMESGTIRGLDRIVPLSFVQMKIIGERIYIAPDIPFIVIPVFQNKKGGQVAVVLLHKMCR